MKKRTVRQKIFISNTVMVLATLAIFLAVNMAVIKRNLADDILRPLHELTDGAERVRRCEKARTDMIAGISHDLRTPLTAIRGAVKTLLDGVVSSPERQKTFLQTAYRRTEDMDALLNQLFYLSRLETVRSGTR